MRGGIVITHATPVSGRRRAARLARRLVLPALVAALVGGLAPSASHAAKILVGAGDIAVCGSSADSATAALLDGIEGTVFTTGDNAYPSGTVSDFANCYDPTWGRHRDRTKPSPGNHDYQTPGAAGYFGYFGRKAGPAGRGYYAYTRGAWRVYSLNSERVDDAQLAWLKADLAARGGRCTLAYFHSPLFSSGQHGNDPEMIEIWRVLYRAGAEVIVNGHEHNYERFAPQKPGGIRSKMGITEFVVGSGGAALRPFKTVQPHSLYRNATDHGVLRLKLRADSYRWKFIATDGDVLDSGTRRCHGRP